MMARGVLSAIVGCLLSCAAAAGIYDAGLYSQVPLTDVSDANRATYSGLL